MSPGSRRPTAGSSPPTARAVPPAGGRTTRAARQPSAVRAADAAAAKRATTRMAIYARVSSDAQAMKGTIDSQLDALRTHMQGIGAEVMATYVDDGYSGARLDRPGLDELRDAADGGAFEEVWCLSPDRLARSFPYQVLIIDELARLGVTVRFTDSPPIDDDPQARLLVQVQGLFAEYERAKLVEKSQAGQAVSSASRGGGLWPRALRLSPGAP